MAQGMHQALHLLAHASQRAVAFRHGHLRQLLGPLQVLQPLQQIQIHRRRPWMEPMQQLQDHDKYQQGQQ